MQMSKQTSAISMPIWLTGLMTLLIAARITAYFIDKSPSSEPSGINWQKPTEADIKGRTDQSKLVLYEFRSELSDISDTLVASTLLRNGVVKLVNEQFLPVQVIEKKTEIAGDQDDFPTQLRHKFHIEAYPTFVTTLPDGKAIERDCPVTTEAFISFLKRSQKMAQYVEGLELLASAKYQLSAAKLGDWLHNSDANNKDMMDAALYCALSYYMLGDSEKVKTILEPAIAKYQTRQSNRWPEPIAYFLLGKIDSDELLKRCYGLGDGFREARSHYFIGMSKLKKANFYESKDDFNFAIKNTYERSEIYYLAKAQTDSENKKRK